jgi:uncharacterized membrane protein YeiH
VSEVIAQSTLDEALGVAQTVMEYAGTVAFAVSGAALAIVKRMDLVGVVVLGTMVSVGGGTLRDVLLEEPVFWVRSPTFVLVGALTALALVPLRARGLVDRAQRIHVVAVSDAAGLALFVVAGTNVALDAGASNVAAVIIGVVSGVGGGVIRDVLANRIPEVLIGGELYATAALVGAALYLVLLETDAPASAVFWVPVAVILGVRLLSIYAGIGVTRPAVGPAVHGDADREAGPDAEAGPS